jgi:hypothetical protein
VKYDVEKVRAHYCVDHGHSNVLTGFFGYIYCARCGAQVGDTLAGAYSNERAVMIGHKCPTCVENAKRLTRADIAHLPKEIRAEVLELRADGAA